MTQEDCYTQLDYELQSSSGNASDEDGVIIRKDRSSVKDMILRFERTNLNPFGGSRESLEKCKSPLGSLTSVVNPIQSHFQHLCPVTKSQDRNSNVSVNSILSNASEHSYESSSSGFISDRKPGDILVPHRPAPPPPDQFKDDEEDEAPSPERKSPVAEEITFKERRYSFTTPSSSPVVQRRSRQPPVIRRKSTAGQGHPGERHWSYGVKQSDLEKLLRLKRSDPSDNEEEITSHQIEESSENESSDSSDSSDNLSNGKEYVLNQDDGRLETLSNDHSTDTLINEENSDEQSERGDDASVSSGDYGDRVNYDNVSIKSISSFDMVPYQKYDSITVSSDEFGSEVCHAPDSEFLTVSAVNEWCISKSTEPVLMPVESKKEKYRRTCLILPKPLDKLYPRVILIRAGRFDPATHNVGDLMCMLYYLVQIMVVEDDVACVMGTKIVTDYEGVTMSHFVQATPSMLKKMVAVSQDSMPLRLKGSHHINLPAGIEKIFTLIQGFLNEKAKQRLKIHKNVEELMEDIPKEIIPPEYGGKGPTIADMTEHWVSKFKEYHDWMKFEEQLGTDESKRIGPPIDADILEDGSFRKLDID